MSEELKPKDCKAIKPKIEGFPDDDDAKLFPCEDCGVMRSAKEGGLTFTVCDECYDLWRMENERQQDN